MIKAITGGSLIQSNFGAGNFEAVVFEPLISDEKYGTPLQSYDYLQGYEPPPESTPDSWQLKGALRHYWLDTSQSDRTWSHGEVPITKEAIGPGCIIQSNFGAAGNFEVVVPEKRWIGSLLAQQRRHVRSMVATHHDCAGCNRCRLNGTKQWKWQPGSGGTSWT